MLLLRDDTYMTSALRGGGGVPSKADKVIKLSKGGCVDLWTRGEGVQKFENFADVICVSPPMGLPPPASTLIYQCCQVYESNHERSEICQGASKLANLENYLNW